MKAKDVILFVYDEQEHFDNNIEYLGEATYKKIIRVENKNEFESELKRINDDEFVFLITHVFYTDKLKGIKKFLVSGIIEEYPLIGGMYVSDGTRKNILKDIIDDDLESNGVIDIKKYHQVRSSIENQAVTVYTKKEVYTNKTNNLSLNNLDMNDIDYVIITALEADEMEKVLPLITKDRVIENKKHLIELGHFKLKPEKKVIYASQLATGMIDAAILATELISLYKPKFLIMTGVMGGKPQETKIGDVIISKRVFTIDKGKIDEADFKKEIETISTNGSSTTRIEREKQRIIDFIREKDEIQNRVINIHFEPVACVRSVINREGFFKDDILSIDRKTIGLEMEGYGIARACELVNNGNTTPLIIKGVMDNTQQKTDDAKKIAAWTSAKVLEYIIVNDLI